MDFKRFFPDYDVKRLNEKDISALYGLCRENTLYYEYLQTKPTFENLKQEFTKLPPKKTLADKFFVGFYRNANLMAILDLIREYPDKNTAFIGWFMVRRELQNGGIGTEIMNCLFEMLKERGFSFVRLGYVKGNKQSESFWKKAGFIHIGKEYAIDGYVVLIMERSLVAK